MHSPSGVYYSNGGDAAFQKNEYQALEVLLHVDSSCCVNLESWKVS